MEIREEGAGGLARRLVVTAPGLDGGSGQRVLGLCEAERLVHCITLGRARACDYPHRDEAKEEHTKDHRRIHTETLQSCDRHWLIRCGIHCLSLAQRRQSSELSLTHSMKRG